MEEIIFLLSLYGIYRVIRELVLRKICPDDKELRKVVLGITKKNTASADKVIGHLGICEKCQERAREIGAE